MPIYNGTQKIDKIYNGNIKIGKIYNGTTLVYQSAFPITYQVDTNAVYTEMVAPGLSVLSPTSFTPSKSGYTFVGWRTDTTANGTVLSELTASEPVTLYAVFSKSYTVSYNGNGNTGGSTASQTVTAYYNNGNATNATVSLRSNGFSKTYYNFSKWAMGSTSGTRYSAGASVTITANTTFYAIWAWATGVVVAKPTISGTLNNNTAEWQRTWTLNSAYFSQDTTNTYYIVCKVAGTYKYTMTMDSSNSGDTESYIVLKKNGNSSSNNIKVLYANGVNQVTASGSLALVVGDKLMVSCGRKSNAFHYGSFVLTT